MAPVVRGRKGEFRKDLRVAEEGIPARQGQRRAVRDRRRAGSRQEVQARHRDRGGPDRRAARHRRAPRRELETALGLAKASPSSSSWTRRRRTARAPAHLLREVCLPGLRLHHRRDRAPALLLQQSLRRLSDLRRHRPPADDRSRTCGAGRIRDVEAGCDRALGEVDLALYGQKLDALSKHFGSR